MAESPSPAQMSAFSRRMERHALAETRARIIRIPPLDRSDSPFWEARLAQADVSSGGWYHGQTWLTAEEIIAAEHRWADRAYRDEVKDKDGWIPNQCGGCRFFAALGLDYGICANVTSPHDGFIVFEHGGCKEHTYGDPKS